eukprot:1722081-Rhodomonas_salina.4
MRGEDAGSHWERSMRARAEQNGKRGSAHGYRGIERKWSTRNRHEDAAVSAAVGDSLLSLFSLRFVGVRKSCRFVASVLGTSTTTSSKHVSAIEKTLHVRVSDMKDLPEDDRTAVS